MSLHLLAPDDATTCCACQPAVCASCSLCPSGATVELTLSGLSACCSTFNQQLLGLGSLNTSHTLNQNTPGEYSLVLPGILTLQNFADVNCTLPSTTVPNIAAVIFFFCFDDFAELIIETGSGSEVLFYAATTAPATQGDPFVFTGQTSCDALQPYTFGGSAMVTPV